ncbi:MAG: S8 family serine peptidase [Truepera sp.]|nr:S8 family serine peptidase [Truepera sp.]
MSRLIPSLLAVALLLLTSCNLLFPEPPPLACFDNQRPLALSRVENPAGLPYVPGQLLVRYQELSGLQPQARLSIAAAVQASFQLTLLQDGGGYGPDLVRVPPGQDVRALAALLSADPRVLYAEPNYFLYTLARPPTNDPYIMQQWNMLNFGLPQAWVHETGRASVTIAIIDTGVYTRHQDLAGRLLPGCDFGDRDNDPNPGNVTNTHGTHVAGIAAATGDNGVGVAGVAYRGVRILPVKVSRSDGRIETSDVAHAIRWAAGLPVSGVNTNPHPAQIINISLGHSGTNPVLDSAVADARRAGAIVVAAAGNSSLSNAIYAPANAPGALAVGSVNNDRRRSSFSNYHTTGRTVDLMAPGGVGPGPLPVSVLSTIPGNQYGHMSGTSMAAPFVAGVAALIWSREPDLTADQVIKRLEGTAYFGSRMNRAEYGAGIVCADAALGASTTCGR